VRLEQCCIIKKRIHCQNSGVQISGAIIRIHPNNVINLGTENNENMNISSRGSAWTTNSSSYSNYSNSYSNYIH